MLCKTIILSNSQNLNNNSPKGILTLSKENNAVKGKIRLYNIISLPPNTKLGLYINEKVHICTLIKKPHHYEFDLNLNIDITQSIYCALIDNSNNDKKVLLEGGSFNGFYFTDSPFDAVLEAKDEQLEQTIDSALKQVDTCEQCNCENCEYKKYFYQNYSSSTNSNENSVKVDNIVSSNFDKGFDDLQTNQSNQNVEPIELEEDFVDKLQSSVINNLEQEITADIANIGKQILSKNDSVENIDVDTNPQNELPNNDEQSQFLNDIIYQLDEILQANPEDDILNNIIPNSRFVRVVNETPYVLGVIYENNQLKYIAYGVPAKYNTAPPADLGQHYQWLPLNPRDVMSDGYFMIYQDALNGNLVEINFEE